MSVRDDLLIALEKGFHSIDKNPSYNEQRIAAVKRFIPPLLEPTFKSKAFPLIVMQDNGDELGPLYRGLRRFKTTLAVSGYVKGTTPEQLTERSNKLSDAIQRYLHSDPSLHANLLDVKVATVEDQNLFSLYSGMFSSNLHEVRLLWYDTMRTVAAPAGTDVFGDQWLDDARDSLVARIEALKTTMASGYDPTFSNVYARHTVPDLRLNAVSVGISDVDSEDFSGAQSGVSVHYEMNFSVRIHTAYDDEFSDDQDTARLMNSVVNKLKAKLQLAAGVRISSIGEIEGDLTFDESETKGGQFIVTVTKNVLHAQE